MSNLKKPTTKSITWGDTQKQRFIKQHGSVEDIPDGDAHAIPTYDDPTYTPPDSPEVTKAAEDSLSEKIKALQDKDKEPAKPEKKGDSFYDEWED